MKIKLNKNFKHDSHLKNSPGSRWQKTKSLEPHYNRTGNSLKEETQGSASIVVGKLQKPAILVVKRSGVSGSNY